MKIPTVFVAVILTTLKDASSSCYRNNLPLLRCISDRVVIPGPVCAPPRCSKIVTTHNNLPCPSTIIPDRLCSHNPIIIPGPCCDVPISKPSYRPACVKKEIVNRITVNNCYGSEDDVCPRSDRFIRNPCSPQCHYGCDHGPIITHSCGSRASINKVAVQNVIVRNVRANDCGSVHVAAPTLCSSCVSNPGSHYHCADRPLIRGCGCETPINKVTVRNVIVKNIPANNYCHCEQPASPQCAPCVSNAAPRFHCAVPPIITRGCGCEPPINKVIVRNVIVKDIPVNDCRLPAPPLCTSCISNPIPHCHFAAQPVVTRGCGCEPPINKVAIRNVIVKKMPKCDCCVQHPAPRCSNIVVLAQQGAPSVPNNFPERCCSPKPKMCIPDPPCNVPVRTIIIQPDCCCQGNSYSDLNTKCCCNNPCVQGEYCSKQNYCYQKQNCEQCCSKCHSPCYKSSCYESDPCCCKAPVRTIIVQPDCCSQRDRYCDLNSKYCCDNPCVQHEYCDKQNCCYRKQSCEQCCSKCYPKKCHPPGYKSSCCESDPCYCKSPVRTIIVQPDCCCQRDRCCDLNSKSCCDNPCFSHDNCCEQNCCNTKHCDEQSCSNYCLNKCQSSRYKCCCCKSNRCCCNKKCCKCFFCKCCPCCCCRKKCKCCFCKKMKCCGSFCSKCNCCQNSKYCKSNCNFTPETFSKPYHRCFECTSRVTPTIIAVSRKC